MKIKVIELGTNIEYIYIGNLTPMQAVNACYEQSKGNYNTWEHSKTLHLVEITKSGLHCFRGDYTAKMKEDEKNEN